MTTIIEATVDYKDWLRKQTQTVEEMLLVKDTAMAQGAFPFLRATYYRWQEAFPELCANLTQTPRLLGVGDLHVQNFGTWQDGEGRLVWGVDDFDEADEGLPMASDLVRLAVSALLVEKLAFGMKEVCEAVLSGYEEGLSTDQGPFVLEDDHEWLRNLARAALKPPAKFWKKWLEEKTVEPEKPISKEAVDALSASYPNGVSPERFLAPNPAKPKGLGSLGRMRFFAYNGNWNGGPLAREVKAAVSPATRIGRAGFTSLVEEIQVKAIRSRDPVYQLHGFWTSKTIMATTGRIELEELEKIEDQTKLLEAMGQEVANVHRGTAAKRNDLEEGLRLLKGGALEKSVETMRAATESDFRTWKKHFESQPAPAE